MNEEVGNIVRAVAVYVLRFKDYCLPKPSHSSTSS